MAETKYTTVHYENYLGLEDLLASQQPRSAKGGRGAAHEEMLFIIVHQSYELWFKQIIHELESVIDMFNRDDVDERSIGTATARLQRVVKVLRLLVEHIPIMESMTPLDFLDFRKLLFPASGFQSFQFRKVENLMGMKSSVRMTYAGHHYAAFFTPDQKNELEEIESSRNLFDAVEDWLERTPFLQFGNFDFIKNYREAVERMVSKEEEAIRSSDYLSEEDKEMRLRMIGTTDTYFKSILDPDYHNSLIAEGKQRLSYKATIAALMISLYNEEPLLQPAYRFLIAIVDMDELLISWRYRHAQMVLRMLGRKVGTGGSSGHNYLKATADRHHIFTDLHNISTLLIPRTELPPLPPHLQKELGYYFTNQEDW